jgi:hypothetical protein
MRRQGLKGGLNPGQPRFDRRPYISDVGAATTEWNANLVAVPAITLLLTFPHIVGKLDPCPRHWKQRVDMGTTNIATTFEFKPGFALPMRVKPNSPQARLSYDKVGGCVVSNPGPAYGCSA